MGFGQKLDALRKLDDAAAALPMPKAVDDVPVDAGDVRKAAPTPKQPVPNELFQTLVSNVLEDIREGEPINPQTQTYIRSVWASMSPDQKASLLNAEGQGPRIVQALEGTPNNMLGDVDPDSLMSRADLAVKEQFPEGLTSKGAVAAMDTAQGKVARANPDDVRAINRQIEQLINDGKLQGTRFGELRNKLEGMGFETKDGTTLASIAWR